MAMIDCFECGAEISSNAKACPKCGGNPDSNGVRIRKGVVRIVVTLGIFLIILLGWTRCTLWLYSP